VVIFADTFSNNFEPHVLHAARRVLQAAGHRVAVAWPDLGSRRCAAAAPISRPARSTRRRRGDRLLQALLPFVAKGVPIVGLEPSCLFTLRDEFLALGSARQRRRSRRTPSCSRNFWRARRRAGRLELDLKPLPQKTALLHGHCHQKAFGAMGAVQETLALVPGLKVPHRVELLRHGRQFRLRGRALRRSLRHGRAVAAAAVLRSEPRLDRRRRHSCRHQIADGANRQAIHVAQVLARTLA
jgi:Fe-S oxidoreductase